MAELKTKANESEVDAFLQSVSDEQQRADSVRIRDLMQKITGEPARMWGSSMVGFGRYRYKYASGREGEWFMTGFSPRKAYLSLHIMSGLHLHAPLLQKLGKYKNGQSCLHIKTLDDVDLPTLEQLVRESYNYMLQTYHQGD